MAAKKPPASSDQESLIRNLHLAWDFDLTVWGDEPEASQPDETTPSTEDSSGAGTSIPEWMETGPIYEITVW